MGSKLMEHPLMIPVNVRKTRKYIDDLLDSYSPLSLNISFLLAYLCYIGVSLGQTHLLVGFLHQYNIALLRREVKV